MGLNKPIIITSSAVDTSNLATKSDLTALQNTVASSVGAVAKIQRGTVIFTEGDKQKDVSLSGFTNLNKMVVLINGDIRHNSSSTYYSEPYISNLAVNKLSITCGFGPDSSVGGNNRYLSYQVIEYK